MTPLPSIAILLSAYNGAEWIEEQIDTILKQQDVSIQLFMSIYNKKIIPVVTT